MKQSDMQKLSFFKYEHLLIPLIIGLLFTAANIGGFFDLLGIRRDMQLFFMAILILLTPPVFLRNLKGVFSPFSITLLLASFFCLLWQQQTNDNHIWMARIVSFTFGTILIATCYNMGSRFISNLLKGIVIVISIYSIMGLLEFIILLLDPELISKIFIPASAYYNGTAHFPSLLSYLGLSTGVPIHAFGLRITRLRSFLSEPSLLTGFFMPLSGVALLMKSKRYQYFGISILTFCILSFAGSVWFTVFLVINHFLFSKFLKSKKLFIAAAFIALALFYTILLISFSWLVSHSNLSTTLDVSALNKTESLAVRFGSIAQYLHILPSHPFGYEKELTLPAGLILKACALGGYLLATILIYAITSYYAALYKIFVLQKNQLQLLGVSILYATMWSCMAFLNFFGMYYLTLAALIIYWAQAKGSNVSNTFHLQDQNTKCHQQI